MHRHETHTYYTILIAHAPMIPDTPQTVNVRARRQTEKSVSPLARPDFISDCCSCVLCQVARKRRIDVVVCATRIVSLSIRWLHAGAPSRLSRSICINDVWLVGSWFVPHRFVRACVSGHVCSCYAAAAAATASDGCQLGG